MTDDRPRPLLAAAFTCERILRETDGVLTAVRLVDTFTVRRPPKLPPNLAPIVQCWILIYFKSGDTRGRYAVSLVMRSPSGQLSPIGDPMPIDLKGGPQGVTLAIELTFGVKEMGLHWIDVLLDGERVTSMPITLQEGQAPEPRQSNSS